MMNLLPRPLTALARKTFIAGVNRMAESTTEEVISEYISDERLKAVLDSQWGNIGAPRGLCSFLVHAAMTGNYLEAGAAYPVGGGQIFAQQLGRVIHENGGTIRVKAKVSEIIIRNNRAEGVRLENGEEVLAGTVISSAGLQNTYLGFLRDQNSCQKAVKEIESMKSAYEYLNLFIGFKKSPAEFGLGNGNTWIHPRWEAADDNPTWNVSDLSNNPNPSVLFFSSSSLRDPEIGSRKHSGFNGQIVTACSRGSFDRWKDTRWKHRDDSYYEFKQQISDRLVQILEEHHPGIRDNIEHMELGTPLSYMHFTNSYNGIPYGLAPVPSRYRSMVTRSATPVKNLFLCGQDMIMPGIPAAVGSANLCCSLILRKNAAAPWVKKARKLNR